MAAANPQWPPVLHSLVSRSNFYFVISQKMCTFAVDFKNFTPRWQKKKNADIKTVVKNSKEVVAKCDNLEAELNTSGKGSEMVKSLPIAPNIEEMIFTIRGVQVMFDRDLAQLYGVSTSRLNQ